MHRATVQGVAVAMAKAQLLVARVAVTLALLHAAAALSPDGYNTVIRHDNSPVCLSVVPACEAKCKGQDYFFICASGNGPMGTPYIVCRCAASAPAVGGPMQIARLVLDPNNGWPGAQACNSKTWANDCTNEMTAAINGTSVTLIPAVKSAFNEECAPASGMVIGPKGMAAAVVFPQYPIGITSTSPDGILTIDFSQTAADDPNQADWSRCILNYRIVQGTFLDPRAALAAQQRQTAMQQQLAAQIAAQRMESVQSAAGTAALPAVATLLASAAAAVVLL